MPLRIGERFDVVELPSAVSQSLARTACQGPYLASSSQQRTWWLVPCGTASAWSPGADARARGYAVPAGLTVLGVGETLHVPMARGGGYSDRAWIRPPVMPRDLADPRQLASAVEDAQGARGRQVGFIVGFARGLVHKLTP